MRMPTGIASLPSRLFVLTLNTSRSHPTSAYLYCRPPCPGGGPCPGGNPPPPGPCNMFPAPTCCDWISARFLIPTNKSWMSFDRFSFRNIVLGKGKTHFRSCLKWQTGHATSLFVQACQFPIATPENPCQANGSGWGGEYFVFMCG